MEATMKLKEFLDDYGESLAQRVTHDLKVLHQPGLQPEPGIDSFLDRLGIKPFPSQREIIKAVVKALREDRRGVYLTAEMGTGKTLMSIAVALLLKKKIRTLVLCPPHLVRKWIAEVQKGLASLQDGEPQWPALPGPFGKAYQGRGSSRTRVLRHRQGKSQNRLHVAPGGAPPGVLNTCAPAAAKVCWIRTECRCRCSTAPEPGDFVKSIPAPT